MSNDLNRLIVESIPNQQHANELMSKLFTVTQPSAVYSEPVTTNGYTVITASEVTAGFGFGYGGGGGLDSDEEGQPKEGGAGGGGGGGGSAQARPVAAIIIGNDGVRVEPIVDPTKMAIAFFTALGAMFMALRKMKREISD